jgi:oligopeptide transport system substrate-binding protein
MLSSSLAGCGSAQGTAQPNESAPAGTEAEGPSGEPEASEPAASTEEKIIRLNNNEEPGSLSPSLAQGTHDSWVIEHCFEGLFRKSPDGGVEYGIVDEVIRDEGNMEDGYKFTFKLKETLWNDGTPLTAHDFEFTYKNVLNPELASEYAYYLYVIKGGQEYNEGTGPVENVMVKAVDDYTLEIVFTSPFSYYQDYMSHYTFLPTQKAMVETNKDWWLKPETFRCNGAFQLTEWINKESIKIRRNPNYFEADKIKLDGADFIILTDSTSAWQKYTVDELDLVYPLPAQVTEQLIAEGNPEFYNSEDLACYYYYLNTTVPPLNNLKVRKALSMSIDRTIITEMITKGGQQPAYGLTPPGIVDYTDSEDGQGDFQKNLGPILTEDIEQAKTLLAEGLAEEGMTEFTFTILYNTDDNHKKIAEAIQNMWKENLGVDVTLENAEFQTVLDRRHAQDFDVARAGWIGDYADPMTFLDQFVTGGSQNDGLWTNARYDELVEIMRNGATQQERFVAMKEAEKILMDDVGIMPIYFYAFPYTLKSRVTDIFKPINRYPQFKYADIVE